MIKKSENINLDLLTDDELRLVEKSLLTVEKKVPSMFTGLNVAQYRAFKASYSRDDNGLIPAMNIISFANGVGKTTWLCFDMIGWTKGPDFLNWRAFPEEAVEYWHGLEKLRDDGLLSLRLTCASDDMKADGSVLMILKEYFPDAILTAMDNSKCYRQIDIMHPTKPNVRNQIAVKTFDQEMVKHAGSTCQRIWINEPLPAALVGETFGRIRSKADRPTGSIAMCATIIESGWDAELDDDPLLRVARSKGHIFENCVGADVTTEMAAEVLKTTGIPLEQNVLDKGYVTNGVLSKGQIETMIALWQRTCPHEVEARKCGSPITGTGRIIQNFSANIHVVRDSNYETIPDGVSVIQIVDPHAAKPSISAWAMITPMGRLVFFDEWPKVDGYGYYDKITERRHTIKEECAIWDEIERGWNIKGKIVARIGDPNRMRDPIMDQDMTIADLFRMNGFNFDTTVNDNLEYGHQVLNEYFWYDVVRHENNPHDISALPKMYLAERCENLRRGILGYSFKKGRRIDSPISEKVSQIHKDPVDLLRYAAVWHRESGFALDGETRRSGSNDYEAFKEGRIPSRFRKNAEETEGGRRVLAW